jgi:hypothetical protein
LFIKGTSIQEVNPPGERWDFGGESPAAHVLLLLLLLLLLQLVHSVGHQPSRGVWHHTRHTRQERKLRLAGAVNHEGMDQVREAVGHGRVGHHQTQLRLHRCQRVLCV